MKNEVKVIKKGNDKIGESVASVSMLPIVSCGNCKYCKDRCYVLKTLAIRPSVYKRYKANTDHAKRDIVGYFDTIIGQLSRMRGLPKMFRWHVSGDILSQSYVDGMVRVADMYPSIRFLAFTKMHHFNYSRRPSHLAIVFSQWPKMPMSRKRKGMIRSWVQDGTETRIPKDAVHCHGLCESCGICWDSNLKHDVFFNIH